MDRNLIVALLEECAVLMELQGVNPFRSNAYRNAARAVQQYDGDLKALVDAGTLTDVKSIGQNMADHITEIARTGRLGYHELLAEQTPPGLIEMLRIPGFGPKRIRQVHDDLKIDAVDELRKAALDGRLATLKGFGPKLVAKLVEGIDFIKEVGQRVLYPEARERAERLLAVLKGHPAVRRMALCGSLRRLAATIKDIDILVASNDPEPVLARFVEHADVVRITGRGGTKASVVLANGMAADLRVVTDEQFPFALHYFTGSKAHNVRMRARAQDQGLKLNEYELAGPDRRIACTEEADVFAALGLDYIPPELREDAGELEAAASRTLPRLIEASQVTGVFHCHTSASDGTASLEEMAAAAKALGYKYLGIADHSQAAAYAGGLRPDKVRNQQAQIDRLNAASADFRLYKGIESDILADGSLDYDDELLATFDYVVASVHSQFNLDAVAMTERIVKAVRNPRCTMLGHLTGRILLRRDAYPLDVEHVLRAAAEHGVMVEINANPNRLDLDWTACKRAKALGVRIVINPDAHSTEGLADTVYGVAVARRGWLEAADVFNTLPPEEVARRLEERRRRS